MIDQIIVVIAEFALIQVFDSPELVGNGAQPPPDVVGDVLGHVVNVADGGEALGQAEAPDRVNYVLLQSLLLLLLLLWRPFLRILFTLRRRRSVDVLLLLKLWSDDFFR